MDGLERGIVLRLDHPMGTGDGDEATAAGGTGGGEGFHGGVEVECRDADAEDVDSGRWNKLWHGGWGRARVKADRCR